MVTTYYLLLMLSSQGAIFNTKEAAEEHSLCKSGLDAQTGLATNLNADLNELTARVNLIAWPNTSPEVVPAVVATWE
jgi:hypothetical protein